MVSQFQGDSMHYAYVHVDSSLRNVLESRYKALISDIDDTVSRLERLSIIAVNLAHGGGQADLGHSQSHSVAFIVPTEIVADEKAKLPCFLFPTARTLRFFNRTDVGIQIDAYFADQNQNADQSFRSLALYGLGGVGKSCVALKYSETRRRRGDLDAMLWIASEKEVSIRQSFTDVAMRLQLPDVRPKDHDENRTLVLDWLRTTSKPVPISIWA